jgi:predicted DNA-binding protein with PD1-like motif
MNFIRKIEIMFAKKIKNKWIIRIEKGEELVATLVRFCEEQHIQLGSITGIGATNQVKIGWFDIRTKEYLTKNMTSDFEITSLTGNISIKKDKILPHLHITLADSNFQVLGGHLFEAIISLTCEVILEEMIGNVNRELDPDTGLYLLNL